MSIMNDLMGCLVNKHHTLITPIKAIMVYEAIVGGQVYLGVFKFCTPLC